MSRWQVLKRHYKNDRVGFVILCWVFGSAAGVAGVPLYLGWTTGNWAAIAFGAAVAATIVWLLHILTTPTWRG